MKAPIKLIYVLDPMCSWCWGFREQLQAFLESLATYRMTTVMGGLAPDTDEPMPDETRAYVQQAWRDVAARTGATFNDDFWAECTPRRSTYPACRAVLAAGLQDAACDVKMIDAIQQAYYLHARNPSDYATLKQIAGEIGLDSDRFEQDVSSNSVETLLQADLQHRRELGVRNFPTLLQETADGHVSLAKGFATADEMRRALR